ncbi:MAG TPA: adenylosuccinate lyase [Elusimicrobia bacterium]|nr:MAG: adenylosuccinate lyase [Elusimicrobia bacterium GWF2_62_30]HBA61194.1 adenylosuccinate lyase [Elusimicrobiota bacterium]
MTAKRDLNSLSPLDGRYADKTARLTRCMGDAALTRYRALVECRYLLKLCAVPGVKIRRLKPSEKALLAKLPDLSDTEVDLIYAIETTGAGGHPPTRHDVKSVEYFLKSRLERTSMKDIKEFVHFGLTSEDVNNLSYALMLRDALRSELLPALAEIMKAVDALARRHADAPLLARTHGQPAVPTTFGKEFRVFHARLARQYAQLQGARICAKLNGAAGNYNAHFAAFPAADWRQFSRGFIESFNSGPGPGLECNPYTTQIEPHDSYAEVFDALRRVNTILVAFCQDVWRYISAELIVQRAVAGEVGSSTMPQKVNPIHFENAEGNLGLANAMLTFFSAKLPVSRLQRDLSDSTVERNFGAAFGHCLVAYQAVMNGLSRVSVSEEAARRELEAHPEVIAEGIQTILRREKAAAPYEQLSKLTRGRRVTAQDFAEFIDGLKLKPSVKAELKRLSPLTYTGLAGKLASGRR